MIAQTQPPQPHLDPHAVAPFDQEAPVLHAQLGVFAREVGVLYREERRRSRQLESALATVRDTAIATMTALAEVVEAKDRTTRGHLDRTHGLGLRLARRVAPVLAARPEVGYGFFLHDIGKVGIPESVLCKPGPLDDDEWAVMRAHPGIGGKIVEPIRFLSDAVEIIRSHHERWDGTGYPAGLAGEQIPLAARIFAVVDSFDAMTSDRPYRRAMSQAHALQQIHDGTASQFDPDIVTAFLDLASEGPLIPA